ncbi:MAG: hypothetical protein GX257_10115, partial [Clostridiales bacterium]|nr:hypothetical protein [Clostridiales bacterium]
DEEIAGWYKANAPFYTSEDQKQWPGYLKAETDGIKVYDPNDALRVLLGSWLSGAIRKYGLKIIGGELYASYFSTRPEGDTTSAGVEVDTDGIITIFDNTGQIGMKILGTGGQGRIEWWLHGTKYITAYVNPVTGDNSLLFLPEIGGSTTGFGFEATSGARLDIGRHSSDVIFLSAKNISLDSADGGIGMYAPAISMGGSQYVSIASPYEVTITCPNGTEIIGGLRVSGTPKNAVEYTEYGNLEISAVECPEVRYIYFDTGILTNGECRIDIDPRFLACIEPNTEHSKWVFDVTPHGKAMLYIDEIGENYFVVKDYHEVADGIEFSWTLSAVRKDFAHRKFMEVIPKNVVESRITRRTPKGQ